MNQLLMFIYSITNTEMCLCISNKDQWIIKRNDKVKINTLNSQWAKIFEWILRNRKERNEKKRPNENINRHRHQPIKCSRAQSTHNRWLSFLLFFPYPTDSILIQTKRVSGVRRAQNNDKDERKESESEKNCLSDLMEIVM